MIDSRGKGIDVSVSFELQGDFSAPAAGIREQVVALLGDSLSPDRELLFVPDALWVDVSPPDAEDTDVTMELYGFRENVGIHFTLSKRNLEGGNVHMWDVVLSLLSHNPGDAVFLYNGDRVVLLRRDGEVTLNQDWDWDDEPTWVRSRLPADVKTESIPVARGD